jgi:hypothetical protein
VKVSFVISLVPIVILLMLVRSMKTTPTASAAKHSGHAKTQIPDRKGVDYTLFGP